MRTHTAELKLESLATSFLENTREEHERLARDLGHLDREGLRSLGGILGRFDRKNAGHLTAEERLLARRVLGRMRKPTNASLAVMNRVLDYLDFNSDTRLDEEEMEVCVEILEMFSRADSQNDSLSERELEMLYSVLRHLDHDNSMTLESEERARLRKALMNPDVFMAEQKAQNPRLRKVLGLS